MRENKGRKMNMELRAPMGGTVWKVQVKVGDAVNSGDVVVILESMKMEIPIEAKEEGTIDKVLIAEGDFVQENDVVVEVK